MAETKLSAADIIAAFQNNDYPIAERVAILRAFRDSLPGLVSIDPHLRGRIRAARAMSKKKIDVTIHALENSETWQQAAAITPREIQEHRDRGEEFEPLAEAGRTLVSMVTDVIAYEQFQSADKVRLVIKAGHGISGDAALAIKPHLDLIAETTPPRRKSPATEAVKKP